VNYARAWYLFHMSIYLYFTICTRVSPSNTVTFNLANTHTHTHTHTHSHTLRSVSMWSGQPSYHSTSRTSVAWTELGTAVVVVCLSCHPLAYFRVNLTCLEFLFSSKMKPPNFRTQLVETWSRVSIVTGSRGLSLVRFA